MSETFFLGNLRQISFLPQKEIIKNKCNHTYCKTSLAETNRAANKFLTI